MTRWGLQTRLPSPNCAAASTLRQPPQQVSRILSWLTDGVTSQLTNVKAYKYALWGLATVAVLGSNPVSAQQNSAHDTFTPFPYTNTFPQYDPSGPSGEFCPPGGVEQTGHAYLNPGNYQQVPAYSELEHTPLFDGLLQPVFNNMWISMEYLHWNIENPGDTLLGAPLPNIEDPSQPFGVIDRDNQFFGTGRFLSSDLAPNLNVPDGIARVPDTSRMDLSNTNGFRGTVGVNTKFGGFESSVFVLENSEDHYDSLYDVSTTTVALVDINGNLILDPITGAVLAATLPVKYAAQPLKENGQAVNDRILYYDSFTADFSSQVWGANSAMVLNIREVDRGLNFSATVGSKYLNIREKLLQRGDFTSLQTGIPINSSIDSVTQNHVWTPQLGLRTEFKHEYVTIGIDPRLGMGLNKWQGEVATDNLASDTIISFDDPAHETQVSSTVFSPSLDLKAYAKIHVRDHLTLTVAYDFMWVGRVVRADEIINYDFGNPTTTNPSGTVAQTHYQDFKIDGLSIGAVVDW